MPLTVLGIASPALTREGTRKIPDELRRLLYLGSAILVQIGIFSIRWNVVIGGQLFSKSLRTITVYKLELLGIEGVLVAGALLVLPLVILWLLVKAAATPAESGAGVASG